jgi:CheY-like chemotaxis protein
MKESLLKDLRLLLVDDEPDVLDLLREEILEACPDCRIDEAGTYALAQELMISWTYDLVVLDIMGVRGFDLLSLAQVRNFPVAMLTAHALTPEALQRSIELGARAYLPKEKMGDIVPFLEDILRYEQLPGWKRLFDKLGNFFNARFGPDWQNKEGQFWKDFNDRLKKS